MGGDGCRRVRPQGWGPGGAGSEAPSEGCEGMREPLPCVAEVEVRCPGRFPGPVVGDPDLGSEVVSG
jgi:hypothetical protein